MIAKTNSDNQMDAFDLKIKTDRLRTGENEF